MDNQNNSNLPPSNADPSFPPLPDSPLPDPQAAPIPDPTGNPWNPTPQNSPVTEPVVAEPVASAAPATTWPPPPAPVSEPAPTATTWTLPSTPQTTSEPVPQPTPQSAPAPVSTPTWTPPQAPASPLDNPWGAPAQPPPLDGSQLPTQPSWMGPAPSESVPTDLSHLINNNSPAESPAPAPETLVSPSVANVNPEIPNLPVENHKGIPKWVIGLGAGLLLLVLGASAYFILGVGQPSKPTTSLPATTVSQTPKPVQTALPAAQPTEEPAASGSTTFGELEGNSAPQATSAADLLRQRQGR